jgi:hypothetical protein
MKTQLHSTGRFLGIGMAAASATLLVSAGNHAQAAPYSGTNAINFALYWGNPSGAQAYTGYSGTGADTTDSGTTWNNLNIYSTQGANNYGYVSGGISAGPSPAVTSGTSVASTIYDSGGTATDVSVNVAPSSTNSGGASSGYANFPGPTAVVKAMFYSKSGSSGAYPVDISGLASDGQYDLYLFGVDDFSGTGSGFSLAAANQIAGDSAYASTSGIASSWATAGDIFNPADPAATKGTVWTVLHAQADANGNLTFYFQPLTGGGAGYLNAFQLQPVAATPEPATVALLGVAAGAGLLLTSRRKRAVNS